MSAPLEGETRKRQEAKGEMRGASKKELLPLKPEIAAFRTDELLSNLLQTKKGLLGNPEKKLKKDVMKRLGVGEDEALSRGALLAYSRLEDVDKALTKSLVKSGVEEEKKKAKEEKALTKEKAKEEKAKAKGEKVEAKSKAGEKRPEAMDLKGEGKVTERASDMPPIQTKDLPFKDAYKRDSRVVKKESTFKIVDKRKAHINKARLAAAGAVSPYISERAKRIEEILGEQRRMDEQEAQKKLEKKKKGDNIVARPFKAVGRGIRGVFGKISHGIFMFFTTLLSIPINLGKLVVKGIGGFLQGIYQRVGRFSPFGWKKKINMLIIYSGMEKTQVEVTGITIVNGVVLAGIVASMGVFLFNWDILLIAIGAMASFGLVWVVVYSVINMMADKRSDEVEGALPDVLQIVGANISAGMTPYNALWISARKEFGALAEEIKIAQKETLGGKAFADALTDMSGRVRSNVMQRTIRLLIQGMKAGGELPRILQGIGNDIREMRLLQKEMAANTMSYILFILFGMVLGAPLLFSVSIQFVDIMNRFQPEDIDIDLSAAGGSPGMSGMQGFDMLSLGGGGCPKDFDADGIPDACERDYGLNAKNSSDAQSINPNTGVSYLEEYQEEAPPLSPSCITPAYLSTFAMICLFSVGFFGSLLIGLIRDGKQSAGLKLAPLLVPATLGMFMVMKAGMSFFFGSMFGT